MGYRNTNWSKTQYYRRLKKAQVLGCGIDDVPDGRVFGFKIDLSGKKFGRLLVVRFAGNRMWECLCECGKKVILKSNAFKTGNTRSCGCLKRDSSKRGNPIHGGRYTPEFQSWSSMKSRCNNPNDSEFANYGGRGIKVCDRWNDFATFLADMGHRPTGTTLDRFPNKNGDYEPGNCRWATLKEQNRNKRSNLVFTFSGVTGSLSELAEVAGINYRLAHSRICTWGWSVEEALSTPAGGKRRST